MREVEYDPRSGEYDEPRMQGLSIRDLRYADDTALLATTTTGLENLIKFVKEHSEQKGLFLNVKKNLNHEHRQMQRGNCYQLIVCFVS